MDRTIIDAALLRGTRNWLDSVVSVVKVAGLSVILALVFASVWAWMHRGEVVLLPFEGEYGGGGAIRLGRALEEVALGSTSGIESETTLRLADGDGPPAVSVPGIGLSLADLVSFLQRGPFAQTRVHGVLVKEETGYQVSLEVFGKSGEDAVRTDLMPDSDHALIQAAEELYRLLNPVALASYLYSRNPPQSLEVIREILSDPGHRTEDEAMAYRLWGLILRDEQDFDDARSKLDQAAKMTSRPQSQARVLVELGHTYLWEERWADAAGVYARAAKLDQRWDVPHTFLGDALQASGDAPGAIREYQEAMRLNPLSVAPWNGLARLYVGAERYAEAVEAYTHMRRLQLLPDQAMAFTYYGLGDALFRTGCDAAAAEEYDRAVALDPSFEGARYDWALSFACALPAALEGGESTPGAPAPPPSCAAPRSVHLSNSASSRVWPHDRATGVDLHANFTTGRISRTTACARSTGHGDSPARINQRHCTPGHEAGGPSGTEGQHCNLSRTDSL